MERLRKVMIVDTKFNHETKKYEQIDRKPGYFHGFFQYQDGEQQECLAVVELENGNIDEVRTTNLKFLEKPE